MDSGFGFCSNHASIQYTHVERPHSIAVTAWLKEPSLSLHYFAIFRSEFQIIIVSAPF